MQRCQAYNIGSGILCPTLTDWRAIPLEGAAPFTIGWIGLQNSILSPIGTEFILLLQENLEQCRIGTP